MTSELVFTSRELVKKKAARVGEWLATFTLFPLSPVQKAGNNATDRVSCTDYFMSIEIIRCSVRRIKTTKPDKKKICGKITLYLFNMTQQCAVAGLPREAYDGCFDAANANKSCVRVHGGQSSEFPIYPTTRERGISYSLVKNHALVIEAMKVDEGTYNYFTRNHVIMPVDFFFL